MNGFTMKFPDISPEDYDKIAKWGEQAKAEKRMGNPSQREYAWRAAQTKAGATVASNTNGEPWPVLVSYDEDGVIVDWWPPRSTKKGD